MMMMQGLVRQTLSLELLFLDYYSLLPSYFPLPSATRAGFLCEVPGDCFRHFFYVASLSGRHRSGNVGIRTSRLPTFDEVHKVHALSAAPDAHVRHQELLGPHEGVQVHPWLPEPEV